MRLTKLGELCRNQWDRTAAVALVLTGVILLVGGWIGASDAVLTFEQIPFLISGGLAGMCAVVLGAAVWLSADLRDEWRKLDRLEAVLLEGDAETAPAPVTETDPAANGTAVTEGRVRSSLGVSEA